MNDAEPSLADLAYEERSELAAYLRTLSAAEWSTESLCRVDRKDVVAHIVSYEELGALGVITRIVKGRFVRANDIGVAEFSSMTTDELLEFLSLHLHPKGLTARFGGMIALVDGTIHRQDIRRALGRPREIPPHRLRRILPLVPGNPRLGAGRRIRGLRLQANDLDWAHGAGPEAIGTAEALLMAMAGRTQAAGDLIGPGAAILLDRV